MDEDQEQHESRKSYREKLKDPRWQKIRLKVFERDKFRCQYCRDTKETLHVHHLEYTAGLDPWDYPLESLITVCASCHEEETMYRRTVEENLLATLRVVGFSADHLEQLRTTVGMAHFPCTKGEFVEFFDWFMTSSPTFEEALRDYWKSGLSSGLEDHDP